MIDNRISDAELLRFAIDSGIIDRAIVTQQLQMANKQRYLDQHKYKIWLANDGYWKTKLPRGDDKSLRLIKKKHKSDLEDAIVEYYKWHSQNYSFKDRFDIWIERQRNCGRLGNSILKYKSDYRRFFEGYPFENLDIRDINEEILSQHIMQVLKDKDIRWRAFKDIMGYVNGVFEKAMRDRVIVDNPCNYLDLPIYKKLCYIAPVKTTKQRTLSDEDTHTLLAKVRKPQANNANMMSCYAIEMAIYTGMRVGELSALKWEDIILDEKIMLIRRSEKYDRETKTSYIQTTKSGKERIFPLTDEIEDLLDRIKAYEMEHGLLGEYVFCDKDGRLTKSKISDAARNYTMTSEFSGIKSIHAIRRTFNSKLKCNGVSTTVASSLLGHTERVNEQNYTYDVSEMAEKRRIVTTVTQNVC